MRSSLAGMLEVFDVQPDGGTNSYVGGSDPGGRDVIDGSQLLAQAIVAAAKSLPGKRARLAQAAFSRPVRSSEPIGFSVYVVHEGRSFGTAVVGVGQGGRRCASVTVMLDTPAADLIRHPPSVPSSCPADATPIAMAMDGREVRLVGVADPNDPDEVGPPFLDAWLRYDSVPDRPELAAALLAHFTGHLSISTTMRPFPGMGTALSHRTLSTAVLAISVSFHEPLAWDGWILYSHESTFAGAGMAYVRGQVRTEDGRLLASFSQDAMIRRMEPDSAAASIPTSARL